MKGKGGKGGGIATPKVYININRNRFHSDVLPHVLGLWFRAWGHEDIDS